MEEVISLLTTIAKQNELLAEQNKLILKHLNVEDKLEIRRKIDFEHYEEGLDIKEDFILECLEQKTISSDVKLLKEFYYNKNIIFPIKKEGLKYFYYKDDEWHKNEESFIEDILISNLVNTYININKKTYQLLDGDFQSNYKYAKKIMTTKTIKNKIIKQFFD